MKAENQFYLKLHVDQTRILESGLPENVNILTLEQRPNGKYFLRLEHFYDNGEDPDLSRPVTVNLRVLFVFL